MTDIWMWGLIASLILLAISTSIKAATEAVTIKGLNDTISELRKQIEMINQKFDEATQKQREIHTREKAELEKRNSELVEEIAALQRNHSKEISDLTEKYRKRIAQSHKNDGEPSLKAWY